MASAMGNINLLQHLSFNSSSTMKLKTLLHTLVLSHIFRMARELSKAKSVLTSILKDKDLIRHLLLHFNKGTKHKHHKVKVYGSFRLHYNWCSSSHDLPQPAEAGGLYEFSPTQFYYDSTWNSVISTTGLKCKDIGVESPLGLSGYLHWLEEKPDHHHHVVDLKNQNHSKNAEDLNEIDKLADLFIASCHEKFRLEKQESYRRFQEMMARSM